ncbi:MAG: hypothetical protein ACREL7_00775 [Longimicrobiales bacterium]
MSPSGFPLASLIDAARRRVRRDVRVAVVAAALLVVPALLAIAWVFAGGSLWAAPSPVPLILEGLGIALIGFVLVLAGRAWRRGAEERHLAATAEEKAGLPAGSVLGALELGRGVPKGTSPSLARRAGAEIARHFEGVSASDVSGAVGRTARRRRTLAITGFLGLSTVAAGLSFASPTRTQGGWTPLLNPIRHLSAPALPALIVRPGNTEVLRGADLEIEVRAPGRANVVVLSRAEGDVLRRQTVSVVDAKARARLERIDATTQYWVEAPDGARSETFTAVPRDPLLVSELVVEVRYPAYIGRPAERYGMDVPPLEVPEGTTLLVNGRATRALREAALEAGEASVPLRIDGDRFGASWTPRESGTWRWTMRDASDSELVTAPAPLEITVVGDVAPDVEVTYPGVDTVLDPERIQVIAADARDDYGVSEAVLVSWRVMSAGRTEPRKEEAVPIAQSGERVLLRAVLDVRERELLPGDTLKYFVRAIDGSPRRQAGESQTYALYIPSAADLRDQADREADEAVKEAQRLSEAARKLQSDTRDLQRRTEASRARKDASQARNTRNGSSEQGSMEFRESEQAKQILEQQEQVVGGLEELQKQMAALEKLMESAGLRDQQLRDRMEELRELYDQLLTPEMKQQMEELRESLEKLDPEQLQKVLEQLQQQQQQLADQLEKSLDQLKKAATEQRANALAQDARELATQQQALSDAMKQNATRDQAEAQQQLEQKARELAEQIAELAKDLEAQGQQQATRDAGNAEQQTQAAQQSMQEAAQRAQTQQGEQASRAGEQAAQNLEQAANNLDAARQSIADGAKQEAQEGIQQAMNEALSLAERQQSLLDKMQQQQQQGQQQGQQQQGQQQQGQRGQQQGQQQQGQQQQGQRGQQQGGQQQQQGSQAGGQQGGAGNQNQQGMQSEQAALQQGLEQLSRNLGELGQQTGMVSRDVGSALGRANLSMQQTMQAMQEQQQSGQMPTQQASQTVEDLNRLALALLQNQQQMQQGENQASMQQAMQQMQNLAQQQGQLNGRSNALLPMQLNQQAMAQQTQRLAQDQRSIANELTDLNQRMGGREDVLGRVDQLAKEADAIARAMEGGRPPAQVLARQERLFHRLLDAGRTLEKDEESDERVGESPDEFERSLTGPLNPALFQTTNRYRVPTPEELRGLPPAYRRLILDYFERINRRPDREGREPM